MPGHSREGQFCWSGSALGTLIPPLHHLPGGACCSLLLFCHLLQRGGSFLFLDCCQSLGFLRGLWKSASATLRVAHPHPQEVFGEGRWMGTRQHHRACPGTPLEWHYPMEGSSWARRGLSSAPAQCTAFSRCQWRRQGTFHPRSTPSDVWQGAKSTDFSEEAETSCSLVR